MLYGELVGLTVDDFSQIADAGDQELRRLAHSSQRGTLECDAEDNDGLLHQTSCTAPALYCTSQCREQGQVEVLDIE